MRATEVFTPGKQPEVTYIDEYRKAHTKILSCLAFSDQSES
jgi:hypothetical protein